MTSDPACVFCQIVEGKIPCHKIYEDEKYLAFLDIHPSTPGHSLVIPKNHSPDLLHTPTNDRQGLLEIVAKVTPAIIESVSATAFNIGINTGADSGQVVFHTHLHIVPRKKNDGINPWAARNGTKDDLALLAQKIRQTM